MSNAIERAKAHLSSDLTYDDAEAIIRALLAIVERLPVTADGVPITPGMELWSPNIDGAAHAVLRAHYRDGYSVEAFGWGMNVQPEKECYSTRAAAEAAREARP